jgi:very-short-patch-repair endonuclease
MRDGTKRNLARHLRRNQTEAERHLWRHLKNRQLAGHRFRRQHPLGPYVLDFVCLEVALVIELDGSQHLDSPTDKVRDARLASDGFHTLRFWNNDALARTEAVLETILRVACERQGVCTSSGAGSEPVPQAASAD